MLIGTSLYFDSKLTINPLIEKKAAAIVAADANLACSCCNNCLQQLTNRVH